MQNNFPGSVEDNPAEKLGAQLSEGANEVKDKVSNFGRTTVDKIDRNLGSAANGLDRAAETLHEKADHLPGVDKISSLTHSAADKLSATAGYVREHDVKKMMADLKTVVLNNPGPSLLAVGVIGFLVGRAFHKNND